MWTQHVLRGITLHSEESSVLYPEQGTESIAYHQVFHPVAQLVNEQDGEVVHCLPKLNPGGLKHNHLPSVSDLSPFITKYFEKLGVSHPASLLAASWLLESQNFPNRSKRW